MTRSGTIAEEVSFLPGTRVLTSGIYEVNHANHRFPHRVTAVMGETFPLCRDCGDQVRFRLVESADHITVDWSFKKPRRGVIGRR